MARKTISSGTLQLQVVSEVADNLRKEDSVCPWTSDSKMSAASREELPPNSWQIVNTFGSAA